ncbi:MULTISPECIES: ABC transporter permease [Rhodococcus]|uniref:ABC transporter permease n=1 Tax=Rhodococcus rhodochrous TaxID=1829 RepID=A0AAW4XLB8_RHORH|nr:MULTISPECIES: ABC transporter permease [Rhodococcus]MCD2113505.1 ABC transporter permease [Rhodococcus rhodochrous]QHG81659.1 ABC transporter permease [Rhodococcus rhodochrous]QOH58665.1 peptide ABC transporter [Rhodococcus rhodochrous]WAL46333.1 ABC transporter permease [Rhodococcus pyridinivorans]
MARTVIDKVIELVVVLFIVSLGTFALVSLIPGDPSVAVLGEGRAPEEYARVRAEMGLDDPFLTRYWGWLSGALQGDLGQSMVPPQGEVTESIGLALPVSFQLALMGLVIAIAVSIPLAMYSARHQGGWIDRMISAGTFGILSVPSFLAGLLLIMVMVNYLGWFPRSQWVRISEDLGQNLYHAFLPALTISLLELAMFTRILRSDLVTTLKENFILVAKAKGMSNARLLFSDALRPSSFSLITMIGVVIGSMIGSTVIVETLFSLPGMGSLIVRAAQQGDIPMVQGAVLVIAAIYVIANAVIDLSYGYLDPRSRRAHV